MRRFKSLLFITSLFLALSANLYSAGGEAEPIKVDWSFKGLTGKFDRASLQRGFQVYKEVCSSCHSMQYLSYRNLGEPGGPEFSEQEVKAIAASVEIRMVQTIKVKCLLDQVDPQIDLKTHIQMLKLL